MTLMVLSLDKIEQFSNHCTKVKVHFALTKNIVMKAHGAWGSVVVKALRY